ncbi:MAG: MMPL family transporter [Thermoplasmata archaeon]|nr:MMPL family transporter [Thermoplasmata archaeon]
MFAGLANAVTKHSKAVIVLWIVIVLCSLPLGLKVGGVLEYNLTDMAGSDSESSEGSDIMDEYFSNSISMNEVVVIEYTDISQAVALGTKITELLHDYDNTLTTTAVGTYHSEGSDFSIILYSVSSSDEDFDFSNETGNIRDVVSQAKKDTGISLTTYVTGDSALTYDTMQSSSEDIKRIDPLSIVLIFVLLMAFFGALVTAVVPPMGFGVAYGVSLLALYLIGSAVGVFYLTETLILVTMLGAGCDYGIFIISRYREELKKGSDHHSAILTAVEWAGESVFTSGMSVIIGFACLGLCTFILVRSMGIALAVGIVFALISALTFVPALVNLIGEKVFWPNSIAKYKAVADGSATGAYAKASRFFGRYFHWVARVTRRHAVPIVAVAVLISIPTFYIYATSDDSYDMISVEPDGEAKEGLYSIMDQTYGGTLMPTYAVIEFHQTVVSDMGVDTLGTNSVPYVKWNGYGLNTENLTGVVPAIMVISNDISAKYDLVASASGLNSWHVLFMQVASEQVTQSLKALYPSYTDEQIAAMVPTAINSLTEAQVYAINSAIADKMPTAVKDHVKTLIGVAHLHADDANPSIPSFVLSASGTTLANFIDGILNVGTGLISDDGRYVSIMIVTTEEPMSDNTMDFVSELQSAFHGDDGYDDTYSAVIDESYITGRNAVLYDISENVSAQFFSIQVLVVILLVILLFFILGCYFTPIRAIGCILLSVIWTLALTFVVFKDIMDIPVCWIVPIVLFVVLLGLGMDYDIFITTRVRENKVRGMSNDDAIDAAICSASGVISLCALIMGGTFLTMLAGSSSMLQEFGFALGVGIIIDGLFMVTFVGPALMHLMGEWSWKGPAFLARKHVDSDAQEVPGESDGEQA